MPYNHKEENSKKYPINIGGRQLMLSEKGIEKYIKKMLLKDRAVQALAKQFELDLEPRIDQLYIQIKNLDGMYAEADAEKIVLDSGLFKQKGDFWDNNGFIIIHEIVHSFTRIKERSYFNDPEEVLGFISAIASEIARNTDARGNVDMDKIWSLVYPKVSFHFSNESDSRQFFLNCVSKAKAMLS